MKFNIQEKYADIKYFLKLILKTLHFLFYIQTISVNPSQKNLHLC